MSVTAPTAVSTARFRIARPTSPRSSAGGVGSRLAPPSRGGTAHQASVAAARYGTSIPPTTTRHPRLPTSAPARNGRTADPTLPAASAAPRAAPSFVGNVREMAVPRAGPYSPVTNPNAALARTKTGKVGARPSAAAATAERRRLPASSRRSPSRSTSRPAGDCISAYVAHSTVMATPASALPRSNAALTCGSTAGIKKRPPRMNSHPAAMASSAHPRPSPRSRPTAVRNPVDTSGAPRGRY